MVYVLCAGELSCWTFTLEFYFILLVIFMDWTPCYINACTFHVLSILGFELFQGNRCHAWLLNCTITAHKVIKCFTCILFLLNFDTAICTCICIFCTDVIIIIFCRLWFVIYISLINHENLQLYHLVSVISVIVSQAVNEYQQK